MNALKPSFMKKKNTITPQKPSSFKDDATTSSSTSLNSSIRSTSSSMRGYDEMQCLKKISSFCKETDRDVSTHLMFRIACFHDFDFDRSKHTIITMSDSKYLGLHMEGPLSKHFGKRIVVPLPDLKARDKSNVVYLRPSRYSGTKNSQLMVDSLCYVLNDLSSTQSQCRAGVTVVVNMKKWARDNFDQEMWVKMIRILQGDLVPTKVMNVLLVDAPEEFRNVWELLEQLMPNTFYKKVNFVKQNKLGDYFKDGFHEHLPNEFKRGWLSIDEVVEDYIDLKQYNDQLVDL